MPPRARNLADIAKAAGVSRMTVSLALRNNPTTAEATRKKIQKLAREMNYRPSPLIATLMSSVRRQRNPARKITIAFLTDARSRIRPTLGHYFQGARQRADELGFKLEQFVYGDDGMSPARLDNILYARGVAGLVIAPLFEPGGSLPINWSRHAVTALGYSMTDSKLHRVVNHQFKSISTALDRLKALGYQRPGLALAEADDARVSHHWIAGYLTHAHLHHRNRLPPPLIASRWDQPTFVAWFSQHKPDVVVTLKEEVLPWIESCGSSVPQDVGLAILNWEPESGSTAGVDQNSFGVGAGAIDVTVAQLYANERGEPAEPKVTLIEGRWRDGRTLRPQ